MSAADVQSRYYACGVCAHLIPFQAGRVHECERCGHRDSRYKPKSARLTVAFALTALIFFIPAMLFPFMTVELYGKVSRSTIWEGIVSLAEDGSWVLAVIVFVASILIPFLKLLILFILSASARNGQHQRFKMSLYRFVEAIGRWSMLDIFLLAVLVAILKLGNWTHVQAEIGSGLFLLVVIFTMLSSAYFDPRLLWENSNATPNPPRR